MKKKELNEKLRQLMLGYRENIYGNIKPPDPHKFLEDVRADCIVAEQYAEVKRELGIKRYRKIAITVGAIAILSFTLIFSPEARAFIHDIGMQINRIIAPTPDKLEFVLHDPDIVQIDRIEDSESDYIQIRYLFDGKIKITLSQRLAATHIPVFANQQGKISQANLLGAILEYYMDEDGTIGKLDYENYIILLSVETTSQELFLSIAQSMQIAK